MRPEREPTPHELAQRIERHHTGWIVLWLPRCGEFLAVAPAAGHARFIVAPHPRALIERLDALHGGAVEGTGRGEQDS